jgi:SAM-dependent methyltransferase
LTRSKTSNPKSGDDSEGQYLIELLATKKGEAILDLGCGSGRHIEGIVQAHRVERVVGLDISESQIAIANRRLARYVKRGLVELSVGDAGKTLPFPSKSFHAVVSAELLECLPGTKQKRLLREIRRVLRPGGRLLLAHTDWDSQVWNATDRALERKLVHAFCDWKQAWMESADGWMGRKLLGLVQSSRLFKGIQVGADVLINDRYTRGSFGYERSWDLLDLAKRVRSVRTAEVRRFLGDLQALDRLGAYFYSVNRYVVMVKRR